MVEPSVVILNHIDIDASIELRTLHVSRYQTMLEIIRLIEALPPDAKEGWSRLKYRRANSEYRRRQASCRGHCYISKDARAMAPSVLRSPSPSTHPQTTSEPNVGNGSESGPDDIETPLPVCPEQRTSSDRTKLTDGAKTGNSGIAKTFRNLFGSPFKLSKLFSGWRAF